MPIAIAEDSLRHVLIATATGKLTHAEFQDFIRMARPGGRCAWPLLLELTDASTGFTTAQVRALADMVGSLFTREGAGAPVALVAIDGAVFGVMRMFHTLCEQHGIDTIKVFRKRAEAESWLTGVK